MYDLFQPPKFNRAVVCIADDPALAAAVSSFVAIDGEFVTVLHGPRMGRPDADSEVIRRCNAAAKAKPRVIVLAGLPAEAERQIRGVLPTNMIVVVRAVEDVSRELASFRRPDLNGEVRCPRQQIAVGLLRALRERRLLIVDDAAPQFPDNLAANAARDHVVVLDDHEGMAQVIAANYAFSISADLALIPARDEALREEVYAELDQRGTYRGQDRGLRAAQALCELKTKLDPVLAFGPRKFVTFVTRGIPYGYFYRDAPSTHLFSYPHLGELIAGGIYWATVEPTAVAAVLVDPGDFPNSETDIVSGVLRQDGMVVHEVRDATANVEVTTLFVQAFPYDLLFICSHCGEVGGHRITVRVPREGGGHRLVELEEAVQIGGQTFGDQPGKQVRVHQLTRPVAVDGVGWFELDAAERGNLWRHFLSTPLTQWDIVDRQPVPRVAHSTAIKLHRGALMLNLIHVIDVRVSPIIFNNSCVSFYEAAATMTFAGARSYVGTLAPVEDSTARRIAEFVFANPRRAASLASALSEAQASVISDPDERTYVHVGCHFNSLRPPNGNARREVWRRVQVARTHWEQIAREQGKDGNASVRAFVRFLSTFQP